MGYLPNPFASVVLKRLAVSKLDFRIHFALNCGAHSCPPIAFYSTDKIEGQLETAMLAFLEAETEVFEKKNEIHITPLFQFYLGDFGGLRGIRRLLNEKLGLKTNGQRLIFKKYDWTEHLDSFSVLGTDE